ncbi:MAG: NAD(P)H-dependent oxidoreductase [Bacteroidia bacterium]|jgi:NAD(P)H-dependent FMN reductase|nr:NAD(P)H-dependent oxidoreductase [Bacteroidia bacterium]
MKVTIVLGTTRRGRQSVKAADALIAYAKEHTTWELDLLDIAAFPFPVFEERVSKLNNPNPLLVEFSNRLDAADALIFVVPEYNGSMPGAFKNAFDHFYKEYRQKPIGLVCVSDGKFGGIQASLQLQALILHVFAFPMPRKWLVPFIDKAIDENGQVLDEQVLKGLVAFCKDYQWFAEAIYRQKQLNG